MAVEVTAIFDIGKTNKKFFLLDKDLNEIHREYIRFDEIEDDDGFMSENLEQLVGWIRETFNKVETNPEFNIKSLNFSTYGASLVHLDENNDVVTPFYNYLKPLPKDLAEKFLELHGDKQQFELVTASPFLGMLNSGLQLFYLKHKKQELFQKIRKSLHFPQYLSSLFSEKYVSDYTSLGCHTGLWDYNNDRYAKWVTDDGFDKLLCPLVRADSFYTKGKMRVGVGIHDSSSALIPYINANNDPFVLISTGTWSITMNLFNQSLLSEDELNSDCLKFMSAQGLSVKASRLFLGDHLRRTVKSLAKYFKEDYESYKEVKWDPTLESKRESPKQLLFDHAILKPERYDFQNGNNSNFSLFNSYHEAVHYLFDELTDLQIASLRLAIGNTKIKKVFIDGGFSSSEVFTKYLTRKLPEYDVYASSFPLGSTLGAALMVNNRDLSENFMEKVYDVIEVQKD